MLREAASSAYADPKGCGIAIESCDTIYLFSLPPPGIPVGGFYEICVFP